MKNNQVITIKTKGLLIQSFALTKVVFGLFILTIPLLFLYEVGVSMGIFCGQLFILSIIILFDFFTYRQIKKSLEKTTFLIEKRISPFDQFVGKDDNIKFVHMITCSFPLSTSKVFQLRNKRIKFYFDEVKYLAFENKEVALAEVEKCYNDFLTNLKTINLL